MVFSSASGIIVQAISLIVARMIGGAWRRREVRAIVVVVVQFILMGEDKRLATFVFADLGSDLLALTFSELEKIHLSIPVQTAASAH